MRAFIDTNVIVDVVAKREPFFADSQAVLALCAMGDLDGVVSDITFCNVAYVLRKSLGNAQLRNGLRVLKNYLTVVPIGDAAITAALESETTDFEDAVQLEAARANQVDVIITRNVRHFNNSPIRVCTPSELLAEDPEQIL